MPTPSLIEILWIGNLLIQALVAIKLMRGTLGTYFKYFRLYLLADDNFSPTQRTLMLAFDWTPPK